jgi:hypothetical protein
MARHSPLFYVLVLVTSLVPTAATRVASAQPTPPEVKTHLDAGDKAAKAKDWEKALTEYRAAFEAGHGTTTALEGVANALYELKRVPEAYEAYEELLRTFGDKLGNRKGLAESRQKELAAKTGTVVIRVTPNGASVSIDDVLIGAAPVPARHVTAGSHKVRVTLAGYSPFEQSTEIAGGASVTLDANLTREVAKGHLIVKEKDGKTMRVIVDGFDVGPSPWEGDLDPGQHEVLVRSTLGASTPQHIEIERGKTTSLALLATAATAHITIRVSEPHALLFLDGNSLAEGSYAGDVPPGEHKLAVQKEGFERYEQTVILAPQASEAIDVKLQKPGAHAIETGATDLGRGIYGGFGLMGLALPNGMGNELDSRCSALGATSCDQPMPLGGGLFGYVGYSFNPVGFELFLGGEADQTRPTAHFPGDSGGSSSNPALSGPARTEVFSFLRAGGFAAVRARVSVEGEKFRLSTAGGVGFAYKYAQLLERTATTLDGKLKDVYTPKGQSYVSPGVTFDVSVQWRIGRPTALSLGILTWIESASFSDVRAPGDLNRYMGGDSGHAAITTPPYQIASGAQIFVGPYLGMQFGP